MKFAIEFHGISADIHADREGFELDFARVTDFEGLMRWALEGATDAQINIMAAELVKEQTARDEAAQRIQDEQDAAGHIGRDAQ